jgi:hypothetical protein
MNRVIQALRILRAALREIFDEAAYQRFLSRTQVASSPEAYAEFWREQEGSKSRQHRCC